MPCTPVQPAAVPRWAPSLCAHAMPSCSASESFLFQRQPGCAQAARCAWAAARLPLPCGAWLRGCMQAIAACAPQPTGALTRRTKTEYRVRLPWATLVAGGALCSARALSSTAASRTSDSGHTARADRPATPPHARAGGWPSAPRWPRPPSARTASWRRPPRTCSASARAGHPRWPARAPATWRASRARCGARAPATPLAPTRGRHSRETENNHRGRFKPYAP